MPGASAVVRGGIVAYATELKHSLLGVDSTLLEAHGAVHPRVARQMAEGVRVRLGRSDAPCDVGISTTGIAGPESPDGQPIGTVHIGVATPLGTRVESLELQRHQGRDPHRGGASRGAYRARRAVTERGELPVSGGNEVRFESVTFRDSHPMSSAGD